MFGVADHLYWRFYSKKLDHMIGDEEFNEPLFVDRKSENLWICFLPWRTSLKEAQFFGLLPRKESLLIYEGPSSLVGITPYQSKDSLNKLMDHFDRNRFINIFNCRVLGLSVGTMPAFYLANNFSVERLVAIATGARLGENIYSSLATEEVKNQAISNGFKTSEDYDEVLKGFNPIDNLENLPQGQVYIEVGGFDKHIPTISGLKLVDALQKNKIVHDFKLNKFDDHTSAILGWGLRNKLERLSYMN